MIYIVLMLLGALGGYIYWDQVGCTNGVCMLKSNPYWMIFYGVVIGGFVASVIHDFILKPRAKKNQ